MPRNPKCTRCPLHQGVQTVCIWGRGNSQAPIILVGEAPGETEDKTGLPFQGDAGKVLDQCLAKAGLNRENIYITNLVRCRPPQNRTPTLDEAKACFGYLTEEVQAIHPKIVIALGGAAIKILSGQSSVARARGSFLTPAKGVRLNGAKLLGTYHPAAYLHSRNPSMLQGLIDDLTFAANVVKPRDKSRDLPEHSATTLAPGFTAEYFGAALGELAAAKVIAMDCEWSYMTDRRIAWPWTRGAELFSISLSGRIDNVIKSVAFACPLNIEQHAVLAAFLRDRKIIFHNAMADLIWLDHMKLPIKLSGDTMLVAHLFNETAELKLETLAETWVGIEKWKVPLWKERPRTQEGWDALLDYNSKDTYSTLLLMEVLWKHLQQLPEEEKTSLHRYHHNLMLPATLLFVRMALSGMPLSLDKVKVAIEDRSAKMWQYGEELAAVIGRKTEQAIETAMSGDKTKLLLREQFGIEADATDAAIMDTLAEEYPICAIIQNIKHEGKLLGTYLRPWKELLEEQGDGRLHSVYSTTRTVTGRTAAQTEKGASVQLVPRVYSLFGDEAWIRALFEAPPGYEIMSIDESALEMRIAAAVAPERGLLERFRQGIDPHTYTASQFVKMPIDDLEYWKTDKGKNDRQIAKVPNFGLLYGLGAEGLQDRAKRLYRMKMTLAEATEMRNWWFRIHSDFLAWYDRCRADFAKGFIRTLYGRYRRSLPDPNKVPNTYVQTPATETVMLALIELNNWLLEHPELDSHLIGFVHDDGKVLVPADERKCVVEAKALEVFRHPPTWKLGVEDIGVPLDAEVHSSKCWT